MFVATKSGSGTGTSGATPTVIMLATPHEMPFLENALDAGASEYLIKPFDADTLLEKLLLLGIDPQARRTA